MPIRARPHYTIDLLRPFQHAAPRAWFRGGPRLTSVPTRRVGSDGLAQAPHLIPVRTQGPCLSTPPAQAGRHHLLSPRSLIAATLARLADGEPSTPPQEEPVLAGTPHWASSFSRHT